jgi:hypothetical protein
MAMRRGHDRGAVSDEEFRHVVRAASEYYNVQDLDPVGDFEFHAATAPVFHPGGELACTLTIWGPPPGAIPHSSKEECGQISGRDRIIGTHRPRWA